jgi:hypothetical protein
MGCKFTNYFLIKSTNLPSVDYSACFQCVMLPFFWRSSRIREERQKNGSGTRVEKSMLGECRACGGIKIFVYVGFIMYFCNSFDSMVSQAIKHSNNHAIN